MFVHSWTVSISERAPSLFSCYCSSFGGKRWPNADSRALAVNGYQRAAAFSPAQAMIFLSVVFCFCPQLITGVKEGTTSTETWDYLRALRRAEDSLIIRLDNSWRGNSSQAHIHPPGFSLTLSVMCHMSQPKAITVILVSTDDSVLQHIGKLAVINQRDKAACTPSWDFPSSIAHFAFFFDNYVISLLKKNKDFVITDGAQGLHTRCCISQWLFKSLWMVAHLLDGHVYCVCGSVLLSQAGSDSWE